MPTRVRGIVGAPDLSAERVRIVPYHILPFSARDRLGLSHSLPYFFDRFQWFFREKRDYRDLNFIVLQYKLQFFVKARTLQKWPLFYVKNRFVQKRLDFRFTLFLELIYFKLNSLNF